MTIEKKANGNELTIALSGRLDTLTAPELEMEIANSLEGVERLILDLKDLQYVSSAGLRVFLLAQKAMNRKGSMKVVGVNEPVMDIFEVTGFQEIMDIEKASPEN